MTVWTANLSNLMHATQDLGGLGKVGCGRGASDAFHVTSRGSSSYLIQYD